MIAKPFMSTKRSIAIIMFRCICVCFFYTVFSPTSYAELTFEEAKKQGEEFATQAIEQGKAGAGNFETLKQLPDYNENPKEASLSVDDLKKEKLQEKAKQDEVGQLIIQSHGKRSRNFEDIDKEEWFKQSVEIIDEADRGIQKDGISACKKGSVPEITKIEFDKTTKTYKKKETYLEKATCEKPGSAEYSCEKKLKLTCTNKAECDNGGIIADTVQTDMKWQYVFPTLNLGTIADNYWGGHCQVYDRPTKFQVRNLDKITEFRITRVGFDDYLWIKINGQTVYVGPHGGDRIELKDNGKWVGVTTDGNNQHSCELGTNWNKEVNIDLKPYLKEGENEIWMRVVVSGWGEGWIQISAKQHCCKEWSETWEKECENELIGAK